LDFVGGKIAKHVDKITYRDVAWERTRFGALLHDFEYIKQRPFFGWGLNSETRHMFYGGMAPKAMGNGLADFTVKFGLVGLVTSLTCIFAGAYHLTKSNWRIAGLFVLFVVIVLNGEHLLDYSLFLGLIFVEPIACTTYGNPRGQQLWDMNEIGVPRF
jgi:O-antigen ligase